MTSPPTQSVLRGLGVQLFAVVCGAAVRASVQFIRLGDVLDNAYLVLRKIRSELVLSFASDRVLERYSQEAYARGRRYQTDADTFDRHLFVWEARAIDRYFPPPPARVLVGGAGGGREAFALAARGYRVVAFEPSVALVGKLAKAAEICEHVGVFRGRYEDLPMIYRMGGAGPVDLNALGEFDAAIVGWTSFTHLRHETDRIATLRHFARATDGPILVSFLIGPERPARARTRLSARRLLPIRLHADRGDYFYQSVGYVHRFTLTEIEAVISRSGLEVVQLRTDGLEYPHAVLQVREKRGARIR
jgi:SAM-dependent methyltransferase